MDDQTSHEEGQRRVAGTLGSGLQRVGLATSEFGYSLGIAAREGLDEARGSLAAVIGAKSNELVFTSGSTEASNMAVKGVALALGAKKGKHVVTSRVEDFPVLNSVRALEKQGFRATYLNVDGEGRVDPDDVRAAIAPDTILVSVQHANQEIGTLQDLEAIGSVCREAGVLFHSDATHTFTRVPLDVSRLPVDFLTLSGPTSHGPRGIGARMPTSPSTTSRASPSPCSSTCGDTRSARVRPASANRSKPAMSSWASAGTTSALTEAYGSPSAASTLGKT